MERAEKGESAVRCSGGTVGEADDKEEDDVVSVFKLPSKLVRSKSDWMVGSVNSICERPLAKFWRLKFEFWSMDIMMD